MWFVMCEMCEMFAGVPTVTRADVDAPSSVDIVRHTVDAVCWCHDCDDARLLAQSKLDGAQLVLPPEFMPTPKGRLFA